MSEQTVSNFISRQFPQVYQAVDPVYVAFVQAYYEYLEQTYEITTLSINNATNNFVIGETLYQSNGTANIATGTLSAVSGPTLTVNSVSGVFNTSYNIVGATSGSSANLYAYTDPIQTGNPVYQARNLLNYIDIDKTLNEFIVYFSNTYLNGIQFNIESDQRLTVKKILDLYRSKGNIRALKLLFQLVFGEDIEVYLPKKDIFRVSDGTWTVPYYLEVSASPQNQAYIGQQIQGVTSGAVAFVDRLVRRNIGGKYIDILFITNVSKAFKTGELLYTAINPNLIDAPMVIGSLSSLEIQEGGYGFNVGDIVQLSSQNGIGGTARVANVDFVTGIVKFTLNDGGFGYTSNSQILISNTIVFLSNVRSTAPTNQRYIPKFSTVVLTNPSNTAANITANAFVISSSANVFISNVTGTFIKDEVVVSSDGNARGTLNFVASTNSAFSFVLNVTGIGNSYFQQNLNIIGLTSNAVGTVTNFQSDIGVIGLSSGSLSNAYTQLTLLAPTTLTVSNVSGTFVTSETVYQTNGTANTATGLLLSSNSTSLTYYPNTGTFAANTKVYGATSSANAYVNVVSPSIQTNAAITGFSTGTNANIAISNVVSSGENFVYYTDLLSSRNSSNVPYLAIRLNANTYGFPSSPAGNLTNANIASLLASSNLAIGEIQSIITTNPGQNYNDNPYVEIYEPGIATSLYHDYIVSISNTSGVFALGEKVSQVIPSVGTALGRITAFGNNATLYIKRLSIGTSIANGYNIVGQVSGANAYVNISAPNYKSGIVGDNANISSNVSFSNGTVTNLVVTTSGYGFVDGETVSFTSNSGATGVAVASLGQHGVGQGYYSSTKGFLSADKYIQDGRFYQLYSYEIRSSLSLDQYADMVRSVVHSAGTALYGAVYKKSYINSNVNITSSAVKVGYTFDVTGALQFDIINNAVNITLI